MKKSKKKQNPVENQHELEKEVEVPNEEIQVEEKSELDELKDRHLRLQAEFDNFRKRTEKEKTDIYKYANEKIIADILPLVDNFQRAIEASGDNSSVSEGIKQLEKVFLNVLEKHGVKEIEATGQFDPNFHYAVMTQDSEEAQEGEILEVLQKGYLINDKVLRPAMVKVAK